MSESVAMLSQVWKSIGSVGSGLTGGLSQG